MGRTKTFKVYVLKAEHTDKIYIGSTKLSLNKRLSIHHGQNCTTKAVELLPFGKLSIELLEMVDDLANLKYRELEYINMYKREGANIVNHNKPIRI